MGMKSRLSIHKTSGFNDSGKELPANRSASLTGTHSNQILLLILIWACFAEAIFLTLEDSLPFAHIEDSGRNGLHGAASFL